MGIVGQMNGKNQRFANWRPTQFQLGANSVQHLLVVLDYVVERKFLRSHSG